MLQRGLFIRFWLFLGVALLCGLLALGRAISLAPPDFSIWPFARILSRPLLSALWTIAALLLAIVIGSFVWYLLYWASGLVQLLDEKQLALADFGRGAEVHDNKPGWAKQTARNPGTLREFVSLRDDPEFRIGIVLAGGGAKGVYQAGALRAIWEFLEAQNALRYVRMVVGTSIGSWNSMFWLTKQVASGQWDQGPLCDWWTSARISSVVNPIIYIPVVRDYLVGNQVWRNQFTELFKEKTFDPLPYFYFTRTNVKSASLEFSTNRKPQPLPPGVLPNYRSLSNGDDSQRQTPNFDQIESATFASMDIPPAFKRLRDVHRDEYEDGGVIDNLPIQFATWCEGCNLLFVLPLNATFAARALDLSILARMARLLDVRQGILERKALTDISLYNRIIELQRAGAVAPQNKLRCVHTQPTTTFCICPGPKLEVGTFGFGSLRRHARACYKLMYESTKSQLAKFDFSIDNTEVWMAKVNPNGEVKYEDFTLH